MVQADICKYIILSDTDRKKGDLQYPHPNVVHRVNVVLLTPVIWARLEDTVKERTKTSTRDFDRSLSGDIRPSEAWSTDQTSASGSVEAVICRQEGRRRAGKYGRTT